ncbi:GRAM-domain-containing protein, partial [Jaminaea rosea]
TGFAVASSKRNSDFHALFPSVPDDDYLIEDYGCALVREVFIQGRLYVSENHICFYANIFGWVTNIVVPFSETVAIEKRMTALIIPNAIQIATLHAKHTFSSFITRDATYDLVANIWKLSHPDVPS